MKLQVLVAGHTPSHTGRWYQTATIIIYTYAPSLWSQAPNLKSIHILGAKTFVSLSFHLGKIAKTHKTESWYWTAAIILYRVCPTHWIWNNPLWAKIIVTKFRWTKWWTDKVISIYHLPMGYKIVSLLHTNFQEIRCSSVRKVVMTKGFSHIQYVQLQVL